MKEGECRDIRYSGLYGCLVLDEISIIITDYIHVTTGHLDDDTDDESEGLGGFMNSFKAISDFINKIIDMIKKMFTFMMGGITK